MLKTLTDMIMNISENQHLQAREKIKSIHSKKELLGVLEDRLLTDDERTVIEEHYINGKSLSVIADFLGYSESSVKRFHKNALIKLNDIL